MNNSRIPQSPATIQGIEKGMAKFVESASLKIEQLEKSVSELRNKPNEQSRKLNSLELNLSTLSSEVETLKISLKDIKLKDLNKYILYKDQQTQKLEAMEKSLVQIELKVNSVDNFVKRLQTNITRLQDTISENNSQLTRQIQQQKSYMENEVKYLIQKQIQYIKGINPDLSDLKRTLELHAGEIGITKNALKEFAKTIQSFDGRVNLLEHLPGDIQQVKRHIANKLSQCEAEIVESALSSVHERLIQPFKEIHRRELEGLIDKIDSIVQSTSSVKDEIVGLVSSSEEIADRRYEQTSKAILEICRILKMANPVF